VQRPARRSACEYTFSCAIRMTLSPTANDVMAVKLPRQLFFLYYPLRPLRLGIKYVRHLLSKLVGSINTAINLALPADSWPASLSLSVAP